MLGKKRPIRVFFDRNTAKFYIIVNKKLRYLKPIKRGSRILRNIPDIQREIMHLKASIKTNDITTPIKRNLHKNYESIADTMQYITKQRIKEADEPRYKKRTDEEMLNYRLGMGKAMLPALWSDQINNFFKNQPLFTGTYCIDEIKNIPNQIPQGFIINTSRTSDKTGEHWQACMITNDSVMFFDSYGDNPDEIIIKQIKDKIKQWQLPILMKLKINKIALQAPESETCGYFCIKWLDDMFKGKTFTEATEFKQDDIIKGDGKTHNEINGENAIKQQFKLI